MLDIRQVYPSPHHPAKSTTIRWWWCL
jgi:hypothetical protein